MQRIQDLLHIVAVRNFDHIISECQGFGFDIAQAHHFVVGTVDLQAVVVQDHGQVVQLVVCGGHAGFPDQAFLAFTVADHGIDTALASDMLRAKRHADCDRNPLPQGTGGSVNTGTLFGVRMALQDPVKLTEMIEFFLSEIAAFAERPVKRRSCVALGEDKAVALGHFVVFGIHIHHVKIQSHQRIGTGQGSARMTRPGF